MRLWSFAISADPSKPDLATGYVWAGTAAEALRQVGHPDANVYELPIDASSIPDALGPDRNRRQRAESAQ